LDRFPLDHTRSQRASEPRHLRGFLLFGVKRWERLGALVLPDLLPLFPPPLPSPAPEPNPRRSLAGRAPPRSLSWFRLAEPRVQKSRRGSRRSSSVPSTSRKGSGSTKKSNARSAPQAVFEFGKPMYASRLKQWRDSRRKSRQGMPRQWIVPIRRLEQDDKGLPEDPTKQPIWIDPREKK